MSYVEHTALQKTSWSSSSYGLSASSLSSLHSVSLESGDCVMDLSVGDRHPEVICPLPFDQFWFSAMASVAEKFLW